MKILYKLLERVKHNNFFILKTTVFLTLSFYIYSILAFSNREGKNFYTYFVIAFLALLVSLFFLLNKDKFTFKPILIPFLFFVLYIFISSILTQNGWSTSLSMFSAAFTFIAVYYSAKAIDNIFIFLNALIVGFLCFSLHFVIIYSADIFSLNFTRLGSYFYNVNKIALQLFIGSCISWFFVLFLKKIIYIIPFVTFSLIIFLTGSRTFILLLFVLILVTIYIKIKKKILFLALSVSFFIAFLILLQTPILLSLNTQIMDMFLTIIGKGSDVSTKIRMLMLENSLYIGIRNIIFGIGTDGFSLKSGFGTYSHNNTTEILANFGLVGLVSFLFIPIKTISSYFSRKRTYIKLLCATISFCLLIASFGTVLYNEKIVSVIIALFAYSIDS